MVDFSYKVINEIKQAADIDHVQIIVENSIQNLQERKRNDFGSRRRFMMNMTMALRYTKAEGLSLKAAENVSNAIEIFERLRKHEYSSLF